MTAMKVRLFLLIGFLIILTGIRWWFAANLELSPDESYYYLWAQHPDISYYSKGPGVALAILTGTSRVRSHGIRRTVSQSAARSRYVHFCLPAGAQIISRQSRFLVGHHTEPAACF